MNPRKRTGVIVVGAGPTGLVVATELARRGVPVRIIDQSAERMPVTESRALGVHAPTMEMLDTLGVADTLLDEGRALGKVHLYRDDGHRTGSIGLDELDVPYPFMLTLTQGRVERILEANLARYGVHVESSTELVALRQGADEVYAHLRDAEGNRVELVGDYLIGCDGAHSRVRREIGVGWSYKSGLDNYILADVRIDWKHRPLDEDALNMILSPRGAVYIGRLPEENRWRIVASVPGTSVLPRPDLAAVQQAVDAQSLHARLSDPSWLSSYRYAYGVVSHLRRGQVFLAGDAAHVHSPVGAQGMNTGIQDAFNLGWKLALVYQGVLDKGLLDTYHAERHPVVAELVRSTRTQEQVMELHQPALAQLRDEVITLVTGRPQSHSRLADFVSRSSVGYRSTTSVGSWRQSLAQRVDAALQGSPYPSAAERRTFNAGPEAGARVPDATLLVDSTGQPRRLHRILNENDGYKLLLFGGSSARNTRSAELGVLAARVAQRYGALIRPILISRTPSHSDFGVCDPHANAHRAFGAAYECLYLIRPDGYIAFRAQPADLPPLYEFLLQRLALRAAPQRNSASASSAKLSRHATNSHVVELPTQADFHLTPEEYTA
ncbi:FAD-dependent monooxygenase [Mycolicibacterium moriokaense]|uniref:2-polyprenyl-6-methoxyphenol hydroxylase-like FAD-dependent oxidoreductase n=1 Tax=Mycolicibacterium moriokaense TaxID=39691 RepID=A0A318HA99_9MYCO|nr:FAD-dependent monooxygenase [Mycolicibacterium moriokaense]PXX00380.1 2-polyprenyl-6-methoxyphenol hydroxylase-like FAD-dependent oxidoreductase [Mycolicibacterium moriokaense]